MMSIYQTIEEIGIVYITYSVWFTLLAMLLTYTIPKVFPIRKFIRSIKMKKILKLKNKKIQISLPFFSFPRKNSSGIETDTHATSISEVQSVMSIFEICDIIKHKSTVEIAEYSDERYNVSSNYNRFVCGGPYVNADTYCLLQEYFHTIKLETTGNNNKSTFPAKHNGFEDFSFINAQNKEKKLRTIVICKDWSSVSEMFKDSDTSKNIKFDTSECKTITYDPNAESVFFVIRLVKKQNLQNNSHGTIHILFGANSKSTRLATNFYIEHTDQIYKMLKKDKYTQNFAYGFIIKNNNEVMFNKVYDLTNFIK